MKEKKMRLGVIIIPIILLIVIYLYFSKATFSNTEGTVVFADNSKVFENFQMKKDYDRMLESDLAFESQKLDSLGKLVTKLSANKNIKKEIVENEKQKYFEIKKQFEIHFSELSKEYTSKVYERLNMYTKEFGDKKKYRLILGSNGQGGVLYVNEHNTDITDKLISFINNKYLDK